MRYIDIDNRNDISIH